MKTIDTPSDETSIASSSMPLIVLHRFLDLVGDFRLDLLGRRSRLDGGDHDGGEVHLRESIDAEAHERERAD